MSKKAIEEVFKHSGLKIMNHVVAGYPTPDISQECIKTMEDAGSDMIEIQIPFSDPMADGLTIVKANHLSLSQGMTIKKFWKWLRSVRKKTQLPLLLMSYYNIPYHMGLENFFSQAEAEGISGIIIPDIPFDNKTENYLPRIKNYDLHPIQIISPSVNEKRLQTICHWGSGFVYTTLKVGITGSSKPNRSQGVDFLKTVRKYFSIPIAAGFGINSPEQVSQLNNKADMAVVGSQIIRLLDEEISQTSLPSFKTIYNFIKTCKQLST